MYPSGFDESNAILNPPAGMTADEVAALSIFTGQSADGLPVVITCWKPTLEELLEISETGRVWLTVLGETMPPVALDGFSPFKRG